jgi:hypothetical protein
MMCWLVVSDCRQMMCQMLESAFHQMKFLGCLVPVAHQNLYHWEHFPLLEKDF